MFVTYSPNGSKPQVWRHSPHDMLSAEQDMVEKHAGTTFAAWTVDVIQGSARARRVLLWLLLRREHRGIRFIDVDFRWSELAVEPSKQELAATRKAMAGSDEPEASRLIASIDAAINDAPDDPDADPNLPPYAA